MAEEELGPGTLPCGAPAEASRFRECCSRVHTPTRRSCRLLFNQRLVRGPRRGVCQACRIIPMINGVARSRKINQDYERAVATRVPCGRRLQGVHTPQCQTHSIHE
ncbi:hypothetical protein TcG_10705 [Trypanosoma cruzi]|nr:hypothetical protein TcG_10705 [Trypanosoma cruzi]